MTERQITIFMRESSEPNNYILVFCYADTHDTHATHEHDDEAGQSSGTGLTRSSISDDADKNNKSQCSCVQRFAFVHSRLVWCRVVLFDIRRPHQVGGGRWSRSARSVVSDLCDRMPVGLATHAPFHSNMELQWGAVRIQTFWRQWQAKPKVVRCLAVQYTRKLCQIRSRVTARQYVKALIAVRNL